MGIFFDQDWFDARLDAVGLTRDALALAAGMTPDEMDLIYKDQREVEDVEVIAFAQALAADHAEVAGRCGVATPSFDISAQAGTEDDAPSSVTGAPPTFEFSRDALTGIHERIDRVEQLLERVLTKLEDLERR